ncbi:MAG: DegT/DnrJ/EryC1/StrS aminotransferase family protein [Candidatus Sumerlaeaceae bacterium]|nr:DegT/DnrJ/EryC1/StrS aminotransferase family protein [Candidatus Sumerlaeaceae bacterium]
MTSPWRIPLSDLEYSEEEELAVLAAVRSKWLTMGPRTSEFEARLADYLGVRHVVAVANCTAALEMAFTVVCQSDQQQRRLVAMPTMTFVATANAAVRAGLIPVLLDSRSSDDPRLNIAAVEKLLSYESLAAICTVHYGGVDAGAAELRKLAERSQLILVEDAAHAIGGKAPDGRSLGTIGHIGCFSFFSNKNLATGEGGALATNDDEIARAARLLRSHGLSSSTVERHHARTTAYDVLSIGHNYRWNEISAALGIVQLAKLDCLNEKRRELLARYARNLVDLPGVKVLFSAGEYLRQSAAHLCVAVFENSMIRDAVREELHRHAIQTSHHYRPVHLFSAYRTAIRERKVLLEPSPHAEEFADRALTLPLYPSLLPSAVDEICHLIRSVLSKKSDHQ